MNRSQVAGGRPDRAEAAPGWLLAGGRGPPDTPLRWGPLPGAALPFLRKNQNLNPATKECSSDLPHDVAAYETAADYNWRLDAYGSYLFALRMKALALGSRRFETLPEMYWQEAHGQIV